MGRTDISNEKDRPGTGESYCSTSIGIRTQLLNTEITHAQMTGFMSGFIERGEIPKETRVWWGRATDRRYGTACYSKREIIMNRRCVETFLHELAHFVTYFKYKDRDGHGPCFGKVLDRLIYMWLHNETTF